MTDNSNSSTTNENINKEETEIQNNNENNENNDNNNNESGDLVSGTTLDLNKLNISANTSSDHSNNDINNSKSSSEDKLESSNNTQDNNIHKEEVEVENVSIVVTKTNGNEEKITTTSSTATTTTTTLSTSTSSTPPTLETNITFQERVHYYKEALKPSMIDISIIQHLAEQGIPESQGLRSIYWKILLNYLPLDQTRWESSKKSCRANYQSFINELMVNPYMEIEERVDDHPLSTSHDSKWNEYFKDQNTLVDIEKDVRRTFPALHFFNHQEESGKTIHYEALRRILFIYAKLNPGIKYVQGMNEVLGPIYYTFATDPDADCKANAEADSFYCFTNLMSEIRDNFCKTLDKSESGVISSIKKLNFLLKKKDRQLWKDLEEKKLHPQFYSFRWITLLLSQEFELPDVLRLWDSLFSDQNRFDFLYYFCCAMLICVRNQLLESPFADNLKLLQQYPNNIDFHTIYSTALSLKDGTFQLNTEDVFKSGQSYLHFFNPFASKTSSPPSPLSWSPATSSPMIQSVNNTNNITIHHITSNNTSNSTSSSSNSSPTTTTVNNTNNNQNNLSPNTQQQTSSFSPPIADSLKNFFNRFSSIR